MKIVPVNIPEGIDYRYPDTITSEKIREYYETILAYFGQFCGDCKYLDENDKCEKGHRPRKYALELGKYDYGVFKKKCGDYEYLQSEIDVDEIKKRIGGALDCNVQQYCSGH